MLVDVVQRCQGDPCPEKTEGSVSRSCQADQSSPVRSRGRWVVEPDLGL